MSRPSLFEFLSHIEKFETIEIRLIIKDNFITGMYNNDPPKNKSRRVSVNPAQVRRLQVYTQLINKAYVWCAIMFANLASRLNILCEKRKDGQSILVHVQQALGIQGSQDLDIGIRRSRKDDYFIPFADRRSGNNDSDNR